MDDKIYERWWRLHLRVAKGEELNPTEQSTYKAGLEMLDHEEKTQFESNGLTTLRRMRSQVKQLQEIHAQLMAKSARLDEKTIQLEKTYQAFTGYKLTSETYASS